MARSAVYGDFQTPLALAQSVLQRVASFGQPFAVLEPTCGVGHFLVAAAETWPGTPLFGVELLESHAVAARSRVPTAQIQVGDALTTDWSAYNATAPLWVVGNPPWVSNTRISKEGGGNRAERTNTAGRGIDAITGAANFDLAEWLLRRLLADTADSTLFVQLVKTSVARRLMPDVTALGLWRIDARKHFGASVDACLFVFHAGPSAPCPIYASLAADTPMDAWIPVREGVIASVHDEDLLGICTPAWRSGVKHDCARVMELRRRDGLLFNGLGEVVDIERAYPLLKSTDVHHGRAVTRALVCTQSHPGEDTSPLQQTDPKTWAYLQSHRDALAARRSRIWAKSPEFGLFGIGPYSFAPYKLALSALHPDLAIRLLSPVNGRPVMVDDTCYFLPFDTLEEAREVQSLLSLPRAQAFLRARTFPNAKRKITLKALQQLDLGKLRDAGPSPHPPSCFALT